MSRVRRLRARIPEIWQWCLERLTASRGSLGKIFRFLHGALGVKEHAGVGVAFSGVGGHILLHR